MREYLFRGQRVDTKEWVYGDLHKNKEFTKAHIHPIGERVKSVDVIPRTVGQFTGLTDKNNVKIFEGDLINIVNSNKRGLPAVVRFNNRRGSYEIGRNGYNPIMLDYSEEIEVIGNIHDTEGGAE